MAQRGVSEMREVIPLNWIMKSMDWSELEVDRVFKHDSAYIVVNNILRLIWFAKIAH